MRAIAILVGLILGVGSVGGPVVHAQNLDPDERDRLSPRLRTLAVDGDVEQPGPRIEASASQSEPQGGRPGAELYRVIVHTRAPESLRRNGIRVHSELDDFVTAHVTSADLRSLAGLESVDYVELARRYEPANDVMRGATGTAALQDGALGENYTGEDVMACVIDTGIDWTHRDFQERDDPTSTRIHSIWDQTLRAESGEQSPSGFDYGVEYTRGDIEAELRGATSDNVRHEDTNGHGTHIAGTIAGNGVGSPAQRHRGAAPEADLVVVKTDFVNVIDGLTYCGQVADEAGQPVVVSLGLSRSSGPHDGSAALARAIDAFVGPGRAVVVAAGNDGNKRLHTSRALSPGETERLSVEVPSYTPEEGAQNDFAFSLDSWVSGSNSVSLEVVTPNEDTIAVQEDSSAVVETEDGALFYQNAIDFSTGDRHVEIEAYDAEVNRPPAEGTWTVLVENESSLEATIHGWMWQTTTGSELVDGDNQYTVGPPATAQQSVAVGAWTHRWRWQDANGTSRSAGNVDRTGAIAQFSSRGPLRGGRGKPDLTAPGHWTASVLSSDASVSSSLELSEGPYALLRGTSMAASATAGAAVLLFQNDPSLTAAQIRQLLTDNARTDEHTGRSWSETWGHGKLDAFQAMADLEGKPVREHRVLAYDDPSTEADRTSYTVGGANTERVAVRFTPEESGQVRGLFLHTGDGDANQLRDSLVVEVRADDEGRPGNRLGSPLKVSPDALPNNAFSFVSLEGSDISVEEGTNYHVVITPPSNAGTLDLAGETASVDGRSLLFENGSWAPMQADLALRVTTGVSLDLQAPSVAKRTEGSIVMDSNEPTLEWSAVSDAERYALQISSTPSFSDRSTRTRIIEHTSHTPEELSSSVSYYWRVRAEGHGYAGPWSGIQSFLYYPASIDVQVSRSFGSTEETSGYRLVALPGNRDVSISSTVEGTNGPDWRAYWDNGQNEDFLVEFDDSPTFHFREGNGFWLISENEWSVDGTVSSVSLRENGTYAIDLHEGWNIISNPFELDVSWRDVEAANGGDLQDPWRFADSYSQVSTLTSAQDGEAFYFFNDQGLEELVLPYPEAPQAPSRSEAKEEKSTLTLATYQEGQRTSVLHAGLAAEAEEGFDSHDQVAPPRHFERTSLRLEAPFDDTEPRRQRLAADYRPEEGNGHTYTMTLEAEPGPPVEIRAEGMEAFEGQQVVLVNSSTAQSYDLRTTSTVTLQPTDDPQSLRLLIGDEAYVETQKEATLPDEIRFPPNYPNPFEEHTSLEYTLPEPSSVRLAIYDVLGRQVDVLVDERQQAGVHTVQWNGRDESDRRVASGLYLARLVVDGTTKVRKMTLVR